MITAIIELIIVLIGLTATAVLFYRFPRLPAETAQPEKLQTVSVIIPARNEEKNLTLLLGDLQRQTMRPLEIICVDDASEDNTAAVAQAFDTHLVSILDKPEDWTGKTWACQQGADTAQGELFLFLDADVRLAENGLPRLLAAYSKTGGTISVQPYHRTEKNYEQLSFIFNLVQIAANGTALPRGISAGLYGPVILICRTDYFSIGGHSAVKSSIVEDMSLGICLKARGLPFHNFVGDGDISFRMYGSGFQSLLEGWIKNLASGAAKTSPTTLLLVFFWVSSMVSVPYHLIAALVESNWTWAWFYGVLYIIWVVLLFLLSKQIGRFRAWPTLLFPIPLAVFLGVFLLSAVKRIFRLKVRWKGRDIPAEGTPCD